MYPKIIIRSRTIAAILIAATLTGYTNIDAGERPGFAFLNTHTSARAAGFAGALIAVESDVHGIFHNPASLAGLTGWRWSADYLDHVMDIGGGSAIATRETRYGVLGFAISSMNYGDFQRLDENGASAGPDFSASDALIAGSFGRKLFDRLSVGVGTKAIFSNIADYSASAIAFDAGVIYRDDGHELTVAGGIFGAGFSSGFIDTKEPLPTSMRAGLTKKLAHLPLFISLEGIYFNYGNFKAMAGGEFTVSPNLRVRLGLNSNRFGRETDVLAEDSYSGATFGFGLLRDDWRFDYSYTSWGGAGNVQRFGISGGM